jgi:hypothetical protein
MIRDDEISHFVVDAGKFLIASLSLGALTYESPVKGDSFPKKINVRGDDLLVCIPPPINHMLVHRYVLRLVLRNASLGICIDGISPERDPVSNCQKC